MLDRRQLMLTAASAGLAATTPAAAARKSKAKPAAGVAARLNKTLDDFFAQLLDQDPETATSLGLDKGAHADLKSKLHRAGVADLARDKRRTAQQLARLSAIPRKPLSGMDAVNYDCVRYDLETTDKGNKRFAYGHEGA